MSGRQRQLDSKCSASSLPFTSRRDCSTMEFSELLGDRQTQSQAAVQAGGGSILLAESLKKMRQKIASDALAIVDHLDLRVGAAAPQKYSQNPAARGELD